jgi:hypothetical protein
MYDRDNMLFSDGDLDSILRTLVPQMQEKVDAIPKDQFLATPEQALLDHILELMRVNPIVLYEESMEMEQNETKVDAKKDPMRAPFLWDREGPYYVPGVEVIVSIPYSGDKRLWKIRPNQFMTVFPYGNVRDPNSKGIGYLDIVMQQAAGSDPTRMKQYIDSELKTIRFYVDAQKKQIDQYNSGLSARATPAINARKERLKKHEGISTILGIPLKQRNGAPPTQRILIRKLSITPLPPAPKQGFVPEPGISDQDYELILSVIRHEGISFETSPKTFSLHDEEGLRDIIIAHLNGHFEGGATGETFRRSGKTDIRIEDKNRSAFIAECKIWRGAKELVEAIDQLLSYLTWRDCKAALVIFNKHNARFTELLEKVPECISSHPKCRQHIRHDQASEWRYLFFSAEDDLRTIMVSVFLFNIFAA